MSISTEVTLRAVAGEYMEAATLVRWLVSEGDAVQAGQPLVLVETAKATAEIEAPAAGYVVGLQGGPGDEVATGSILARIVASRAAANELRESAAPASVRTDEPAAPADRVVPADGGVRLSPRARRLARERASEPSLAATMHGGYAAAMASAMARSAEIPQFSVAIDCDGDALLARRAQGRSNGEAPTLNDWLIAEVGRVLRQHPLLRSRWEGGRIVEVEGAHIAVAISTQLGLVAPVVRDADKRSADAIAAEMRMLKQCAAQRTLRSEHLSGASFTLSNLGALGIDDFTALVSAGQSAVLAVSAFKAVQVRGEDGRAIWRMRGRLRLSADHRVVSGADAAAFLRDLSLRLQEA